jgi:hypothetical protein
MAQGVTEQDVTAQDVRRANKKGTTHEAPHQLGRVNAHTCNLVTHQRPH